jgi:adenine specific DNA methylase Mod
MLLLSETEVQIQPNTLFYGDNLGILHKYFPVESADLIYLDPPFNSKADYNVLFKETTGQLSEAQIQSFSDFWHWDEASEKAYMELQSRADNVADAVKAFVSFLGRNDLTAYLVMMTIRLVELHRVLKQTGSLYIHCDPTASHYLKSSFRYDIRPLQLQKRNNMEGQVRITKDEGTLRSMIQFYSIRKAINIIGIP